VSAGQLRDTGRGRRLASLTRGPIRGLTRGLTPRDQRALGVGLVAIALLLTLSRGMPAWRAWRTGAARAARVARTAEAQDLALRGARRLLFDTLAAREARLGALRPLLFRGESVAAASAALGSTVSGAASQADVALGALALSSDSLARAGVRRIAAHGSATGDIQGIARFLATLEMGPHRLALRSLRLTASDPAAADDHVEALAVEFTVEGLMRADTAWRQP
jgi:hypothetical protein